MADLPNEWHEIERPGKLGDIDLFISSDGSSWELPFQLQHGTPLVATPLTGLAIDAEIRSATDQLLLEVTAAITIPASGWCKVSATNAQVAALCLPVDAPVRGKRFAIGRLQIAITDSRGRWVLLTGDVWGNR